MNAPKLECRLECQQTPRRVHDWRKEILNATHGCAAGAYSDMRIILRVCSKAKPVIQQFTTNRFYVGLSVYLTLPYNDFDRCALHKQAKAMGFMTVPNIL